MVVRVVEGTLGVQGTVSGTDQTLMALTNAQEHTSPNVLRVWIENQTGAPTVVVNQLNTVTGSVTLDGADGITIITDVPGKTITVSGFRDEFVAASGYLQSLTGGMITLQDAYDNGTGVIQTTAGKPVVISGTPGEEDFRVVGSGTFTEALSVGTGTTHLNERQITTASGSFSRLVTTPFLWVGGDAETLAEGDMVNVLGTNREHRAFLHSGPTDFALGLDSHATGNPPGVRMYRSFGDHVNKTSVTSGTVLGVFAAYGFDEVNNYYGQSGRIRIVAKKDHSEINVPGQIQFHTSISGVPLHILRGYIDDDGWYFANHDLYGVGTISAQDGVLVSGTPVNLVAPDVFLSDVTTISGHLQSQIDSIDIDEIEPAIVGADGITVISGATITTVSGFQAEFVTASGHLQGQITTNSDHGNLSGLLDDDHTQYILVDGTRAFTGDQSLGGNNLTNVNEITAVTGTFTEGITVGDGTSYIYPDEIRSGHITATGIVTAVSGSFSVLVDTPRLLTTTSSRLDINSFVTLEQADSADISSGAQTVISLPSTQEQDGEGSNINVFTAFDHSGITKINSAQVLSVGRAFRAANQFRETSAITSGHTLFHNFGFSSEPGIRVGHDGTSTAFIPALAGYSSAPNVARESGNTGSTTISLLAGFATNVPDAGRAVFGTQQLKPGFTVNKYAHFIAHSDVTNGLLNTGATVVEEIGLDLQSIGVGSTAISIRSDAADAFMSHRGHMAVGTTGTPQFNFAGFVEDVPMLVVSQDGDIRDLTVVKYNNSQANHIVFARARGSETSPSVVTDSAPIYSIQSWGYDGSEFVHTSSINAELDQAENANLSTAIEFKNRRRGGGSPQTSAYIRSDGCFVSYGRQAFPFGRITSGTLTADAHNYDPEPVSGTNGLPDPVWKLAADSSDRTITGIFPPAGPSQFDCQFLNIFNAGASNNIILANESSSSSAEYRIITPNGQDLALEPNQATTLVYDQLDDRWRVISHSSIFSVTSEIVSVSGHLQTQIDAIEVDEIEPAIVGSDGITIISGSNITTVSGFRSEFVTASGHLQSQIDSIEVDEIEPAIIGEDGITVTSGSSTTTLTGFYPEFVAASGYLQDQFDPLVASSGIFSDSLTVSGIPVQASEVTSASTTFSSPTTHFPFTHNLSSINVIHGFYVQDSGLEKQVHFDEFYILDSNTVSGTTTNPISGRLVIIKGF